MNCKYGGNKKKLCNNDECEVCFERSFASHHLSCYWSGKNGSLKPRQVFKYSHKTIFFDCDKCTHTFSTKLSHITKDNSWCPYCADMRLCEDKTCKICFDKSFSSVEQSKYWSKENGNITPRDVFKRSPLKRKFTCNFCNNIYENSLNNITAHGQWCNCTKNKTEAKLYKWLQENDYTVKKEAKYEWCKNDKTNRFLPFDFVIESRKLIIELDGRQHFTNILNWRSCEEQQIIDIYKMKQAIINCYTVIRLLQEDVFGNKNDWENKLRENIELVNENPTCIYICNNNEYECYKKLYNNNQ